MGLKMTKESNCQHLLVECDCGVNLVDQVDKVVDDLHPLKSVINSCQFLQGQFSSCDIRRVS